MILDSKLMSCVMGLPKMRQVASLIMDYFSDPDGSRVATTQSDPRYIMSSLSELA